MRPYSRNASPSERSQEIAAWSPPFGLPCGDYPPSEEVGEQTFVLPEGDLKDRMHPLPLSSNSRVQVRSDRFLDRANFIDPSPHTIVATMSAASTTSAVRGFAETPFEMSTPNSPSMCRRPSESSRRSSG